MQISVVIPTCNRKKNLLLLLDCLSKSGMALNEVIIVDSGEDPLHQNEIDQYYNLNIQYLSSEKSVCIQRNAGIKAAKSEWIFLCDDDIEVPADYLFKLGEHIKKHPQAGAVSGLILQLEKNEWVSSYPVNSVFDLAWRYMFRLTIWGPLCSHRSGLFAKKIIRHYSERGNHITAGGWPVITDFSGDYFETPIYGLGASLIKKEWLLPAPFDEILDRHGIGDNYGLAIQLPAKIQVVNHAFVYHHRETANRLQHRIAYYRRILALDYFRQSMPALSFIKKRWLLWSLNGNLISHILKRDFFMVYPTIKAMFKIAFNRNDYIKASIKKQKITTPQL